MIIMSIVTDVCCLHELCIMYVLASVLDVCVGAWC